MPVRDPSIAQAFANVAEAFRPPSGMDMYGFARAGEQNMRNQSLAEYYRMANDPTVPQEKRDAAAVAAGLYAPTQSYYSVDQGNLTSRQNNAASNAAALKANAANNARIMAQTRYGALAKDAVLPEMPASVADQYGLPASGPVQGNISLQPGERVITPDNRTLEGPAKPLTMPEWEAAQAQELKNNKKLNDAQLTQLIMGGSMSDVAKLLTERDSLPAGDPNRAAYNARIDALGRGQQQSKYDQVNDEKLAALNDNIFNTAQTSFMNKGALDRMTQLLSNPNVDPGALAETGLAARKILSSIGFDMGDVSDAEALTALGKQFALKLRDPSQGAGMPGALSDSDRAFLASMAPGLEATPQGNAKIIEYFSRVNNRNIEVERLRQQYVREKGRLDDGFRAMVTEFATKNPLFPEAQAGGMAPQAPQAAAPAGAAPQFKILSVRPR